MTNQLPDPIRGALERPELSLLWQRIRKQLERNNADPRGSVTIPVGDLSEASELGALLGVRLTHRVGKGVRVDLAELDRRLRAGPAQLSLADLVVILTGGPLLQQQKARAERMVANGLLVTELLELMASVPELRPEQELLAAVSDPSAGRVPVGSATGTTSWSVYDAAIRAACFWWPQNRNGHRVAAKELATHALRGSKHWTDQRQLAFANLVRQPFDHAVDSADIAIRLSGPLLWKVDETIANAAAVQPWIAVPAGGIRSLGYLECSARGILLIENSEPFEQVCLKAGITDRWLCVWNEGNPSKRLIRFLADLALPVAAWCDLDAYGIRMIHNLERALSRPVSAVGMEVEFWRRGPKLRQTPEQLTKARRVAASMSTNGPEALRELAEAIAVTGDCCEQEALYAQVLPTLQHRLRALESAPR
jgi:hypothetical protein